MRRLPEIVGFRQNYVMVGQGELNIVFVDCENVAKFGAF